MILVGRPLRRRVSLALLGDGMDQDRTGFLGFAHVAQHRQQVIQVMPVDRTDVVEAHFLEQRAAGQDAAGIFLGSAGGPLDAAREALGHAHGQVRAATGNCATTSAATDRRSSRPTGGAIDMSLSLRMTISREFRAPALFIAS